MSLCEYLFKPSPKLQFKKKTKKRDCSVLFPVYSTPAMAGMRMRRWGKSDRSDVSGGCSRCSQVHTGSMRLSRCAGCPQKSRLPPELWSLISAYQIFIRLQGYLKCPSSAWRRGGVEYPKQPKRNNNFKSYLWIFNKHRRNRDESQ